MVLRIEAGTMLRIGRKGQKIKAVDYSKSTPPMTLKFTLEKIESVLNLVKGDFIGRVIELSRLIINGEFDDNLGPNILSTASLISDIRLAVI